MDAVKRWDEQGQGTVEAAFALPIMFLLVLLLVQPGILLYDRMVMQEAASEACRLLATKGAAAGSMDAACEAFVRHRLSAIPQHECFHVHEGGCSWQIDFAGDENSSEASVEISGFVRPLPLLDGAGALLGVVDANGYLTVRVRAQAPTQPAWVAGSEKGLNPSSWAGAWLS